MLECEWIKSYFNKLISIYLFSKEYLRRLHQAVWGRVLVIIIIIKTKTVTNFD